MPHYNLALIGFGNVARALTRLLLRKQEALKSQYGVTFSFTGIATRKHGCAINSSGIEIHEALDLVESGKSVTPLSVFTVADSMEVIRNSSAQVMFENSPVNNQTGQPALDYIRDALNQGMHVITANKGPVVYGYRNLTELAKSRGKIFGFESTVLSGAPLFSVFRESLPLAEIHSFKGILNSTTNIILSRMENGESYAEALAYCQSIGVAETDPTNDVDGWDAAIKVAALATVLMDSPLTPQQVDPVGIRGITDGMIAQAKAEGRRYKLVCSAQRAGDRVVARVAPELLDSSSPLYGLMNSSTGVTLRTDVLSDYSITSFEREGMLGGPIDTAYGLFADFVNAVKADTKPQR